MCLDASIHSFAVISAGCSLLSWIKDDGRNRKQRKRRRRRKLSSPSLTGG